MNPTGFLFLTGWALFFVVPRGYGLTAWLVLLVGTWAFFRHIGIGSTQPPKAAWSQINWVHLAPFLAWGSVSLGVMLFHGERPNTLEQTLPYLLSPLLYVGLKRAHFSLQHFFIASALAAIGSGLLAMGILLSSTGSERVVGLMSNHIAYGNLSALFGLLAVFGLLAPRIFSEADNPGDTVLASRLFPAICFVGGMMGIAASFASGTKGGWISIVSIGLFLVIQALRSHGRSGLIWTTAFFGLLLLWTFAFPNNVSIDRLDHAFEALSAAISVGGPPTDGSIGARWAMITHGFEVYAASGSWLLGVERDVLLGEVSERISPLVFGGTVQQIPNLHNEVMDTLATRGLVGMLAYIALYAGLAWVAFRPEFLRRQRQVILLMLIAFLEFGLSNVQFEVGSMRLAFVILMFTLLTRTR